MLAPQIHLTLDLRKLRIYLSPPLVRVERSETRLAGLGRRVLDHPRKGPLFHCALFPLAIDFLFELDQLRIDSLILRSLLGQKLSLLGWQGPSRDVAV